MSVSSNRLPVPCPVCSATAYVLCSTDAAGTPHEERIERAQGAARDADRLTMELRFGCLDRALQTLSGPSVSAEDLVAAAAVLERYVTGGEASPVDDHLVTLGRLLMHLMGGTSAFDIDLDAPNGHLRYWSSDGQHRLAQFLSTEERQAIRRTQEGRQ